ncbi:MAG: tRNA preQ1(34) S-adenosylmethionine ribosyltransferase-isomerase QueA [Burkholderiaceae bacterium]
MPESSTATTLADFDFELPEALIAQHPLAERSSSRLLHVGRSTNGAVSLHDRHFAELPGLLRTGDLLVVNDSRVLAARLHGRKASGGAVEVLIERVTAPEQALAMIRASKSPRAGSLLLLDGIEPSDGTVTVLGRDEPFFRLRFARPVHEVMAAAGKLPLPPYIDRAPGAGDDERYQTVYARSPGSVAAPTAGLHFDRPLLDALAARGIALATVTLHVGAGTFAPVRENDLAAHRMHEEHYVITAATARAIAHTRAAGGRVVAVGTTSLRSLESAARRFDAASTPASADERAAGLRIGADRTRLFLRPGDRFAIADALITNFHLPRSTLLMLVAAFAGLAEIRAAYAHAIAARYRFFSYGDAMFLDLCPPRIAAADHGPDHA